MEKSISKAVLFDIGNVLLKLKYEDFLDRCVKASTSGRTALHAEFSGDSSPNHLYESGAMTFAQVHQALVDRHGLRWDESEFERQFNDFFEPNPPMEALLERLASDPSLPLWALSNTNATHLSWLLKTYPLFGRFKAVLASHELGLRKPDPRIYRAALDRMERRPDQVFFIDDNAANVLAAQGLGVRAFHYTFNDPELALELQDFLALP